MVQNRTLYSLLFFHRTYDQTGTIWAAGCLVSGSYLIDINFSLVVVNGGWHPSQQAVRIQQSGTGPLCPHVIMFYLVIFQLHSLQRKTSQALTDTYIVSNGKNRYSKEQSWSILRRKNCAAITSTNNINRGSGWCFEKNELNDFVYNISQVMTNCFKVVSTKMFGRTRSLVLWSKILNTWQTLVPCMA